MRPTVRAEEAGPSAAGEGRRSLALLRAAAPFAVVALLVLAIGRDGVGRREIDGLDQAAHVMDGLFFADLLRDAPIDRLGSYPFDYYAQYPALGFIFWPPFFPFVEGLFFLVVGPDLIAARLCLLAFCLLMGGLLFCAARERVGRAMAVLCCLLVLTTPLIARSLNTVMLEAPALAMMLAVVCLNRRLIRRGEWRGWGEVVAVAAVAAAAVYTKQTVVFLFPALLVDIAVNRPALLRRPRTWAAAGLFVLACLPLAAFTLKYASLSVSQAFGDQGSFYVETSRPGERWSVASLLFYLFKLPRVVHPVLAALVVAGIGLTVAKRDLLRDGALWYAWLAGWWLLFTIFDAKETRYFTLAVPAVVLIAVGLVHRLTEARPRWRAGAFAGLVVVGLLQGSASSSRPVVGYRDIDRVVRPLVAEGERGNIFYLGAHRQLFVPFVRLEDRERRVFVLQGDDLLRVSPDLNSACRDFRVGWLLIEERAPLDAAVRDALADGAVFELVSTERVTGPGEAVVVRVYRHRGPLAATMRPVPLRSEVLGLNVR